MTAKTKSSLRGTGKKALAPIPLPEDLAMDLEAFCAAHYKAEKAEVIRRAVRFFIDARLADEPKMRARFLEERALLTKSPGAVVQLRPPEMRSADAAPSDTRE
jgi:hypothetical protein